MQSDYWERFRHIPTQVPVYVNWDEMSTGEENPNNWHYLNHEERPPPRRVTPRETMYQHSMCSLFVRRAWSWCHW